MKLWATFFCMLMVSVTAGAETTGEKLIKLQAANDALTERVAELLQENRRLQNAVKEALNAQKAGSKIVSGCDTRDFNKIIAFESGMLAQQEAAMSWLKKNGGRCSKDELAKLFSIAASMAFSSATQKLINYYQSGF